MGASTMQVPFYLLERLETCQTGCWEHWACPDHNGEQGMKFSSTQSSAWEPAAHLMNSSHLLRSPAGLGGEKAPRCHRLRFSHRTFLCSPLPVTSANLNCCECDLNLKQMQWCRNLGFQIRAKLCPRCVRYFRRQMDLLAAVQTKAVKTMLGKIKDTGAFSSWKEKPKTGA